MLLLLIMALGRRIRLAPWVMLALLIFEVGSINIVIAINGAASNAYNVILLIPLVLAFMLLPLVHAGILLIVSIASQASQLFVLASHTHQDMQMLQHFRAMVGSFIVVNLLVAAVVFYFRFQLARREQAIQNLRERQLRDEQLLAIGTAAAQFSHDVATPTQSIRLLLEEILEQQPQSETVLALNQQFERIEQHLRNWRDVADDVREQRTHAYNVSTLWSSLKQLLSVARPESSINWSTDITHSGVCIDADRTLLPALTSVIINACEAATKSEFDKVQIEAKLLQQGWTLIITNHGQVLSKQEMALLGSRLVHSHHGHGVGAVLTNATIEKFSGEVKWEQHDDVMITTILLPVSEKHANSDCH